ncbi:hypothetical protein Rhe02_05260 [Rhizocola hellebori]|uniref:Peptidase C14 caspase domain-containing protein n=1 Tax=Rhizocola hellebori TaxID=1392758 RepID=A0A8J3Q2H0_9ACTN|nr:caspase family protein [Rhizocola hellebori]GIH02459.1 hypothetical protein Rhe02_05260 [Rhizocola hellebori]
MPHVVESEFVRVILLGAAAWPSWPSLDNDVFERSYLMVKKYVEEAMGVPAENVLDLFGSADSPNALVQQVQEFLRRPAPTAPPTGVLIYYVGHGDRLASTGDFAVFTAVADSDSRDSSAFRLAYLVEATRESGRELPLFLVLDACFSASAAEAFQQPVGSAGVAVFASASSGDYSRAGPDEPATPFTKALIDVLARGEPESGRHLSLRDARDMVEDELTASSVDRVRPELHSPYQRRGDVSEIGLFPNPAYGYRPPPARGPERMWCAVVSQADGRRVPEGVFADAIVGFKDLYRGRITHETGWLLRKDPVLVAASTVFDSPRGLQEAVAQVCQADLAFFDITGLEPAVMVLLGIRAVIRRGVTICFTSEAPRELATAPPFLLRDINVVSCAAGQIPEDALGKRALAGIQEFLRSPYRYADLPGFDGIRQLPPTVVSRTVIPYFEKVLVLCSFSSEYDERNWRELPRRMAAAVTQKMTGEETAGDDAHNVRIERTLDMGSPRVVSANLLEAIRLTDLCLCDLTGWRPNVLFELGLRLAANPLDPVCIIDTAAADEEGEVAAQRRGLLSIFNVLAYEPSKRKAYYDIVDRHLAMKGSLHEPLSRTWAGTGLPVGGVHRVAWQYADARNEPTAIDVVDLLHTSAMELRTNKSRASTPFIFPAGHAFTEAARRNAQERLIAAWLYLQHRGKNTSREAANESDLILQIGYELIELLADSADEDDRAMAAQVYADIKALVERA